ncbi:hypothetical protein D1872_233250 [compost metagenome]
MYTIAPNMPALIKKPSIFPKAIVRILKRFSGIIGSLTLVSIQRNKAIKTAPVPNNPIICGDVQAYDIPDSLLVPPSTIASSIDTIATIKVIAPYQSMDTFTLPLLSFKAIATMNNAGIPTGILI